MKNIIEKVESCPNIKLKTVHTLESLKKRFILSIDQ
jgi:hypothetical protein